MTDTTSIVLLSGFKSLVSNLADKCGLTINVYENAPDGFTASIFFKHEFEPYLAIDLFADVKDGNIEICFSQFFYAIFKGDFDLNFTKSGEIRGIKEKEVISPIIGLNLLSLKRKYEENGCIIIENYRTNSCYNIFFARDHAGFTISAFECFFQNLILVSQNTHHLSLNKSQHMAHL